MFLMKRYQIHRIHNPEQINLQINKTIKSMDIQPLSSLAYHNFDAKLKRCGCYIRNSSVLENVKPKTHVAIPLKHIDYDIEVTNGLVSTTLEQTYVNPTEKYLEIDFSFPIDPKACVYKFVAEFGNRRIEGVVKEKEEAKKEYKEAVKQGKQAVYAEIDSNSKDIMNMEIGNLAPSQSLKITISYLQELNVEQNTFYQLHIPSTISPRYMNDIKGRQVFVNQVIKNSSQKSISGEYTWTFKITLLTSRALAYYVSHSHNLQLISQNQPKTETILCLAKEEKPNVDLALLFTVEDFHLPNYVLGRTDLSCTSMLSFIPKFCELSLDDAMKASMVKKQLETDMSAAKGEYIFLLDRSGSMGGKRIQKAKQALTLFLQSLPQDTYFNVVSFGDGSSFMFKQSTKYTKESLQTAVKNINPMRADMGGTEIYNPLFKILQTKVIEGYPKQIFLLTDGGVSNTEGVIALVGNEVKYSRCHSIGIGNGCSEALIKGCAEKGKGRFIFISDEENPSEKIIGLLEETLTPVIDHVTLKYDKSLVKSIVPNPDSLPYILKNEVVNFYITFNNQLQKKTCFTFGYTDSMNKSPFSTNIEIDPESPNMPFVDKMAHNKIIKNLEISAKDNKPIEDYMYYVKVVDKKKQAIEHSVKYQILSEYTAFICVGKELVDGKFQEIKDTGSEKVKIEPMVPEDYMMKERLEDLCLKSANLSSSSMIFSSAPMQCSMAVKKSSNMAMRAKVAPKTDSKGFFKNVVSSVTNFFGGSQQSVMKAPQMAQRKQNESRSRNLQNEKHPPARVSMMAMKKQVKKQEESEMAQNQMMCCQMEEDMGMDIDLSDMMQCKEQAVVLDDMEDESQAKKEKMKKKKEKVQDKEKEKKGETKPSSTSILKKTLSIEDVIKQQNTDGSFGKQDLLKQLFPDEFMSILSESEAKQVSNIIAITYAVAKWIQKNHPSKQYGLIVKKALSFIKKSMKLEDLEFLDVLLQ